MTTERELNQWRNQRHKVKKRSSKSNFFVSFLWVTLVLGSVGLTIKNNPETFKFLESEQVQNFLSSIKFNGKSLGNLTEKLIVEINEPITIGSPTQFDQSKLTAIDQQIKFINYQGNSVQELADILSPYATTDLEKARIIYTWITKNITYDVEALLYLEQSYPDVSTENVLTTRSTICSGYAILYQELAKKMGLKSTIVLGYAKGIDYIVGEDNRVNHAWNAVKIEDKWYLIDSTWGAGTVSNSQFNQEFNPYYFATPPEELIYSHYPEEPKWQLLAPPYTRETFDNLPEVSGELFKNKIELASHPTKNIYANDKLNITLKAPKNVVATAKLSLNNESVNENYTLVQNDNGDLKINVGFPMKGDYKLEIFAKPKDKSNSYPHVVTYEVIANNSTDKFPKIYRDFSENNGYLEAPLTNSLTPNQLVFFRLKIDHAMEVKVVNQTTNQWTDLTRKGNFFSDYVTIGNGKTLVYARFPGDSRYWGLLEFN
jgi:hypothetical protein